MPVYYVNIEDHINVEDVQKHVVKAKTNSDYAESCYTFADAAYSELIQIWDTLYRRYTSYYSTGVNVRGEYSDGRYIAYHFLNSNNDKFTYIPERVFGSMRNRLIQITCKLMEWHIVDSTGSLIDENSGAATKVINQGEDGKDAVETLKDKEVSTDKHRVYNQCVGMLRNFINDLNYYG